MPGALSCWNEYGRPTSQFPSLTHDSETPPATPSAGPSFACHVSMTVCHRERLNSTRLDSVCLPHSAEARPPFAVSGTSNTISLPPPSGGVWPREVDPHHEIRSKSRTKPLDSKQRLLLAGPCSDQGVRAEPALGVEHARGFSPHPMGPIALLLSVARMPGWPCSVESLAIRGFADQATDVSRSGYAASPRRARGGRSSARAARTRSFAYLPREVRRAGLPAGDRPWRVVGIFPSLPCRLRIAASCPEQRRGGLAQDWFRGFAIAAVVRSVACSVAVVFLFFLLSFLARLQGMDASRNKSPHITKGALRASGRDPGFRSPTR